MKILRNKIDDKYTRTRFVYPVGVNYMKNAQSHFTHNEKKEAKFNDKLKPNL